MTSLNHPNNLCSVTLPFPSSTPPFSSAVSSSSTSSTGWTQKITEKIQELKKLQNDLINLKNAKNNYLTEQDSKSLDCLPTQVASLETVKKLAEFADQLDTNKTNSNNILNNLCTGLEKFLGFNKESKGYTGSGIVYSDLDRLCDGVMGFLLSIITHVKKDTNLTIYNGNLETILNSIKRAKYNRNNFDNSIVAVSQGIRDWVRGVEEKHESVMRPLYELEKTMNGHINAFMEDDTITEQLGNWQGFAGMYVGNALDAEQALNGVDKNLRDRLVSTIGYIKQLVMNFGDSVSDDSVTGSVKALDDMFLQQRSEVKLYIISQIKEVEINLKETFHNIKRNIMTLKHVRTTNIQQIAGAVNLAHQFAEKLIGKNMNDFDNIYRKDINQKFENIKNEIEKFTENNTPLMENFLTVRQKVEGLEDDVRDGLTKLKESIEVLKTQLESSELLKKEMQALEEAKKSLNSLTVEGDNSILSLTKGLEVKFKNVIQQNLTSLTRGIGQTIKKLGANFGDGIGGDERLKGILDHIKVRVGEIKGSDYEDKGLQAVVARVKGYVEQFSSENGFKKKVKKWVEGILKGEQIKQWLDTYMRYNKNEMKGSLPPRATHQAQNNSQLQDNITEARHMHTYIVEAVENELGTFIQKAAADVKRDIAAASNSKSIHTNQIEAYFKALIKGCNQFATDVEANVKEDGDINPFVKRLLSTIESKVKKPGATTYRDYTLEGVVKTILIVLAVHARQAGPEVDTLVKNCKLSTLYAASSKAQALFNNIYDAATVDVDREFSELKSKVNDIDNTFTKEVKHTLTDAVNKLPNAIIKFDSAAKESIKDAADTIIEKALANFTMDSSGDEYKINVKNLMKQFEESRNTLEGAVKDIHKQHKKLKSLPGFVTTKNGEAGSIMENLKAKITKVKDAIERITPVIEKAGKAFDSTIETLEKVLQTTQSTTNVLLPLLQKHLQGRINIAFNDLEVRLRLMFDVQKKAELRAIHTTVSNQIPNVESIIVSDMNTGLKGLLKKINGVTTLLQRPVTNISAYSNWAKSFYEKFLTSLKSQSDLSPHSSLLTPLADALSALLSTMNTQRHFDHAVSLRLAELQTQLDTLTPTQFSQASPLLNVVKAGVQAFHGELAKQYVSRYSGKTIEWLKDVEGSNPGEKEPTEEALKCGKVFFSCLQMLFDGLHELRQNCARNAAWEHKTISLTETAQHGNTITNPLGRFFKRCGYTVCSGPNKHNGELRNTVEFRGGHVHKTLTEKRTGQNQQTYVLVSEHDEKNDEESKQQHGLLKKLFDHLHNYYRVRHVSTFSAKTYPTSVYDMLQWLCGLTYNSVHETLSHDGFSALFEKPENGEAKHHLIDDMPVELEDADSLEAYPQKITAGSLSDALAVVCHYSHDVLTTILGHGHDDGAYACDFNTNSGALMYPSNMDTLLCMMCDIVNRLYRQLHFLYNQCQYNTELSGWLDCEYGKGVGGASWRCNVDQCVNQTCNQKGGQRANQNGNQKADQPCDQHPKCGVKSPLQSFLEDGLQGFLPHQLKYEKGKVVCSVKDHSGIECITPLGFSGISHMASHRATGQRIVDVLAGYCGNQMSPLTRLCSLFNCVIPTPPKTLGQMFGFYCSLLVDWEDSSNRNAKREVHRETAFNKAVGDADFANPETSLDMTSMFKSGKHNPSPADQSSAHLTGDLYALVKCNGEPASDPSHPCGAYLRPLCYDICSMFSKEHADKYLSWIVYLTETFYTALQKLLEDCQKTCGADARKCKIGKCKKDCGTKEHPLAPSAKHNGSCGSIVECGYIRPTFFRYGFIHENVNSLSGVSGDAHKRTCTDFCTALRIVTKEGNALYDIVNKTIPEFLWTIRQKFFWTTVALWSLSLFYLICVMVGRLDVLHIRSHLRSPSSHRITAQSLLAAAQVGRLAKISYLQP